MAELVGLVVGALKTMLPIVADRFVTASTLDHHPVAASQITFHPANVGKGHPAAQGAGVIELGSVAKNR